MNSSNRPKIICHMMSTIDGKITSGTGVDILEDYFDLYKQTENELGGQAWICGRKTMEMFAESVDTPLPSPNKSIGPGDFINQVNNKHFFIAVDTQGKLRWKSNEIKLSNVPEALTLVVVVLESTPKEYLSYLQNKGITYLFGGKEEINFEKLFEKIRNTLGIEKLLLEGGGKLNGSVLDSDLIDEISLIIAPKVLNRSSAPSVFDFPDGEINPRNFELIDMQKLDKGAVWLRYKRSS